MTRALSAFVSGCGLIYMATQAWIASGFGSVLPGMLAMGAGMGLSMTTSIDAIPSALPREKQGVASALNDVTREPGTALGVGLLGALLFARYRHDMDGLLEGIAPDVTNPASEGVATSIPFALPKP